MRDATTYVMIEILLSFQRETNAFHCITNGGVVNVIAHYCGDATLQINRNGLHAFDGTNDLLSVGTTMVAGHATHHIGLR